MRKFVLSTIAAIAVSASSVFAADLPAREPAPAPVYAAPVFTWTGFYVGLNGSYTWSQNSLFIPGGPTFTAKPDPNSFGIGAQVGYRYQFAGGVVLGLEADASWLAANRGRGQYFTPAGVSGGADGVNRLNWDASLRASLGYSFGNILPYVTGGVAFVGEKGCGILPVGGSICVINSNFNSTRTGWTVGAGLAYAINQNWSVNAEYRYADFGKKTYVTPSSNGGTTRSNLQTHKVLVGLNYRFGGPAGGVVAKY